MTKPRLTGAAALLLSSVLLAACSSGLNAPIPELETAAPSGTVSSRIGSSSGDAEEVGGSVQLTGAALDFNAQTTVGMRFEGLAIPRGATIRAAYIDFRAIAPGSGSLSLTIRAHDSDASNAFSGGSRNLSSRSLTTASSSWRPLSWSTNQDVRTSDLRSVVQEVVSRGGWQSGNALSFTVRGSGSGKRQAMSVDKSRGYAPRLVVAFGSSGGGTPPPTSTPSSGSCLNRSGSLVKLKGSYSSTVTVARRSNVKVDARGASLRGNNFAFVAGKNSGSFCLSGGSYRSNRSSGASWSSFHSTSAIYFENVSNPTVENVTTSNSGDGVTFKNNTPNFLVRDSRFITTLDDTIEVDRFGGNGTIRNNLVERTFTFFSCRAEANRVAPRNVTINIEGNVVGLRRLPNGGHNYLWKWTQGSTRGCRINLRNNVFLLEDDQAGYINSNKDPKMRYDPLNESACRGNKNVVVYTGGNRSYLAQLKAASPTCFDVTTDINVWNRARSAWLARH